MGGINISDDLDKTSKNRLLPSINGLLGIISFSTRIPINRYITIEEMAGSVMLWPYVGLCIGAVASVLAYVLLNIFKFNSLLLASFVYCFVIWFTGFNHIDGVLDMGDGLMAHGSPERRLEIMRDSMVGTGGITAFFIVALLTVSALYSISSDIVIYVILIMEMCAKYSMTITMLRGDDDKKGIGRLIKDGMNYKILIVNYIIISIINYSLIGIPGLCAAIAAIITGFFMSHMAQKNFGCVTGDIMGASNEISRLISLFVIVISSNLLL